MKNYDSPNYPIAIQVENIINQSGGKTDKTDNIKTILPDESFNLFLLGCILYWAETEHYDARNRYTLLASRVIVKKFPQLKQKKRPDSLLQECGGFTHFAHRYLQNELFKDVILPSMEKNDTMGIYTWFRSQQFVYNEPTESLIPFEEYKRQRI